MRKMVKFQSEQVPACPNCETPLLDDSRIGGLSCRNCNYEESYNGGVLTVGDPAFAVKDIPTDTTFSDK